MIFKQGALHPHFAVGPADDVSGPVCLISGMNKLSMGLHERSTENDFNDLVLPAWQICRKSNIRTLFL